MTVLSNGLEKTYLPLTDGLGNVRGLVDAQSGTVASEFRYDPYGVPLAVSGGNVAEACPFRFQTKYWDAETGLYYFGYRYYNPSSCKWLCRDPIQEQGGINLTAYCANDPINQHDPAGLEILYIGTEEEITLLERFHEALSKGSFSGKTLMDRLNEKGFIVKYRFGPPPNNSIYKGQTLRREQFGTRSVQISSSNKQKIGRPLYSSDVYLNKKMFVDKDGKIDLNLAFATFIHESIHAYDNASRADLEPEENEKGLSNLLSSAKRIRILKDVESYGKISGWTTLFEDSDPIREYRAIRGVRGIRAEAGNLFCKLIKAKQTSLLENHFGSNQEYVNLLWRRMPLESYTEHKGAPLPELIKISDGDTTTIEINKNGEGPFQYRYIWE